MSGQFITRNIENNQYYLDMKKSDDYDAKIEERAKSLSPNQTNEYYYRALMEVMECPAETYRAGFKVWPHNIIWYQPKFSIRITKENLNQAAESALFAIADIKRTQQAVAVLDALGLMDGGKITPYKSPYTNFILGLKKNKGAGQVINRDEIITAKDGIEYLAESKYRLEPELVIVIIATLVAAREVVLAVSGAKYDASKLSELARLQTEVQKTVKRIVETKNEIKDGIRFWDFNVLEMFDSQLNAEKAESTKKELKESFLALSPVTVSGIKSVTTDFVSKIESLKIEYIAKYSSWHSAVRLNTNEEKKKNGLLRDVRLIALENLSQINILPKRQIEEYKKTLESLVSCSKLKGKEVNKVRIIVE